MKNQKITLESTAIEFNKWREKRHAREPVPDRLWSMVAQIYDHYPHTLLCQKLNLRLAQLKARGFEPNSTDFTPLPAEDEKLSAFVHVPPEPERPIERPSTPVEMSAIEIHRPDGTKIIFTPNSHEQLSTILHQFIGG